MRLQSAVRFLPGPDSLLRMLAALSVVSIFLFLLDNTLIYWFDFPGLRAMLTWYGLMAPGDGYSPPAPGALTAGLLHLLFSVAAVLAAWALVLRARERSIDSDAEFYSRIAAYLVRAAFWAVFLVGIADMIISFLRVEGLLPGVVGDELATQLGRSAYRGAYVHFPLILASVVIAAFTRTLGFIWLALLIVAAEFLIVLTRFVFSYEQAFMGDLVRFWYAGLFLFASAYTLLNDGHVRVDVFYANFSERGKALTNAVGSLLLGLPLCWTILVYGMAGKGSIINSPLLSFEISQSGFGMFTKYLMAAYLLVFAVTMAIQFTGFILANVSRLRGAGPAHTPEPATH